jgi:hypothetical protein
MRPLVLPGRGVQHIDYLVSTRMPGIEFPLKHFALIKRQLQRETYSTPR